MNGNYIEPVIIGVVYKEKQDGTLIIVDSVKIMEGGEVYVFYTEKDNPARTVFGFALHSDIQLNIFHSHFQLCIKDKIEKLFNE